ncbi:MAG: hypothetical protein ABIF87_17530 [Pseudomonadota bacterium]
MSAVNIVMTKIKPKLLETFGGVLGNNLITKGLGAMRSASGDEGKYKACVDAICSDPQVVGLWGQATVNKIKAEWLKLV